MASHTHSGTTPPTAHPPGLATLFLVEMWERFSYYGMRAILVLYCVAPATLGGLGFSTQQASSLYGTYIMAVYLLSLPGGFIADRWLGAGRAVFLGGLVISAGQFCLLSPSLAFFYSGLSLITIGTGLLKPNVSAMVGALYPPQDPRRDSGFSIFYMGINVGAVLAPLVCGFLAESPAFQSWLAARGLDPHSSWRWGFAAAGVGMLAGLAVFLLRRPTIAHIGLRPQKKNQPAHSATHAPLTADEARRLAAISILFVFTILFWSAYEQKGASLNLFAKHLVQTSVGSFHFPASWLQSITAFYVILLAPLFARLWVRLGRRQPSSPAKFAIGLAAIGFAFCILTAASGLTAQGRISPLWLAAVYLFDVIGELCLSPVGLSTVTKVAPARLVGLMMGAWFFATSLGNKLAGFFSTFFDPTSPATLMTLYGSIAAALLVSSLVLFLAAPALRRLMGDAR
ncbi:MAG: peptide MFS transporter [Acidobacteria bacterium]|nr:peptide MFS transporter [Acidobacteriota bacterium]